MTKLSTLILASLLSSTAAFAPTANVATSRQCTLHMSEPESAFVADPVAEETTGDDSTFDAVEKMGRGAAKVRLVRRVDMRTF